MTKPSPNINKSKKQRAKWVYLGLYIFFSLFIVFECSINAVASADQSGWVASILAGFVNAISPNKTTKVIKPIFLSLSPDQRFVGTDVVIQGKAKLINYTLQYDDQGSTNVYVYDSSLTYERKDGSGESDYSVSLTSSASGGQIRLVTYGVRSDCHIVFSTSNGIAAEYRFDSIDRPTPKDFVLPSNNITIAIGDYFAIEPTLYNEPAIGKDVLQNETEDHYLQRVFDNEKIVKISSDESIATIDPRFGIVKGLKEGFATISYGSQILPIHVTPQIVTHDPVNSVNLDQTAINAYLNEFSSWSIGRLGTQLNATVLPSSAPQGVHFYSSDSLVAMVSNAHLDSDENNSPILGGFVQGYAKEGSAYIYAVSDADPTKFARCLVTVAKTPATSVSYSFYLNGEEKSLFNEDNEAFSGDVLSIVPNFLPSGASMEPINVISNDESVAVVLSNGTVAPKINFLKAGSVTLSISIDEDPGLGTSNIEFSVKESPFIPPSQMGGFSHTVRKIGHAICFGLSSIFLFLFLLDSIATKKRWWLSMLVSLGAGFILAVFTECIQYFIPKRTPSWFDVFVDMSGVFIGILIIGLVLLIKMFVAQKNKGKTSPIV